MSTSAERADSRGISAAISHSRRLNELRTAVRNNLMNWLVAENTMGFTSEYEKIPSNIINIFSDIVAPQVTKVKGSLYGGTGYVYYQNNKIKQTSEMFYKDYFRYMYREATSESENRKSKICELFGQWLTSEAFIPKKAVLDISKTPPTIKTAVSSDLNENEKNKVARYIMKENKYNEMFNSAAKYILYPSKNKLSIQIDKQNPLKLVDTKTLETQLEGSVAQYYIIDPQTFPFNDKGEDIDVTQLKDKHRLISSSAKIWLDGILENLGNDTTEDRLNAISKIIHTTRLNHTKKVEQAFTSLKTGCIIVGKKSLKFEQDQLIKMIKDLDKIWTKLKEDAGLKRKASNYGAGERITFTSNDGNIVKGTVLENGDPDATTLKIIGMDGTEKTVSTEKILSKSVSPVTDLKEVKYPELKPSTHVWWDSDEDPSTTSRKNSKMIAERFPDLPLQNKGIINSFNITDQTATIFDFKTETELPNFQISRINLFRIPKKDLGAAFKDKDWSTIPDRLKKLNRYAPIRKNSGGGRRITKHTRRARQAAVSTRRLVEPRQTVGCTQKHRKVATSAYTRKTI